MRCDGSAVNNTSWAIITYGFHRLIILILITQSLHFWALVRLPNLFASFTRLLLLLFLIHGRNSSHCVVLGWRLEDLDLGSLCWFYGSLVALVMLLLVRHELVGRALI